MYRSHSPYGQPQDSSYPAAAAPIPYVAPVNGNVQPGDTTYTQIVSPDGRMVFQLFRAVPASYQTANGVINGVQWVAGETVGTPPPGSRPANPDFVTSWMRSAGQQAPPGVTTSTSSSKSSKDRDGGKRSSHNRHTSDYDSLSTARERDAAQGHRRSTSFNASAPPGAMVPFPGGAPAGYPPTQQPSGYPPFGQATGVYSSPYGAYGDPNLAASTMQQPYGVPTGPYGVPPGAAGSAYSDGLARQMNDLDINRSSKEHGSERERKSSEKGRRSRRQSFNHDPAPRPTTADPYTNYAPQYNAPAAGGGMYAPQAGTYPNHVPYPAAGSTHSSRSTNPSPNMQAGEVPYPVPGGFPGAYASSTGGRKRASSNAATNQPHGSDIYGQGHILEGYPTNPNAGGPPRSRATTPNPPNAVGYLQARPSSRMGPSPHAPPNPTLPAPQLAAPEAFSRAINAALPYHSFKPTKIHNMDDFFSHLPKMPSNLESHDVRNEDWFRFMEDLTLAWTGRLPVNSRDPKPPRPSVVAAELFHTWNTAFFEPRGIEIVLYKGRQRRSGRLFGRVDLAADDESDDSSSESSESSSDSDDPYPPPPNNGGYAGRDGGPPDDLVSARRRYYQEKMQTIERRRERRRRRRERRKNKNYAFYAICTREGAPKSRQSSPIALSNSNMSMASAYPGMLAMPVPPPMSKKSKHGRGQSQSQSIGVHY